MTTQHIAAALQRVEAVLQRRPEIALHDDAPASAHWQGNMRVSTSHANGTALATDMPTELGGTGDHITPGWLFRAGGASCAATSIALAAAADGIALSLLEVRVTSRSDVRGLLGMADANGAVVGAGPFDMQLLVRIAAPGAAAAQLRALVERGCSCSPIPNAVTQATPLALLIEVEAA